MNNRLQQFLELENLTPARLADMLGIQRSGLSHILSGRNKPSYDFLNRILTKFPHINADWLMTGKGKAYRDTPESVIISGPLPPSAAGSVSSYPGGQNFYGNGQNYPAGGANFQGAGIGAQAGAQNFQNGQIGTYSNGQNFQSIQTGQTPYGAPQDENSPILDSFDDLFPEGEMDNSTVNDTYNTDKESINPDSGTSQPAENCVNGANKAVAGKKKRVKRVIVFYSDGSFEELFPHIR